MTLLHNATLASDAQLLKLVADQHLPISRSSTAHTTRTNAQAGMKRVVKILGDQQIPGGYRVEIWVADEPEFVFHYAKLENAQKRYNDEVALGGF